MTTLRLRAEGLGKRYRLGASTPLNSNMRDALVGAWSRMLSRGPAGPNDKQMLWALRDVSFDVREGERVGFIGRNGAGKSTLLKIISRLTEPTEGRLMGTGRVATLLEIGTGFHPELSGRENIFLSGAVMGMRRVDIVRRFDEIVAFSEIERFLDTPVKRYSSGMYVRLAFAVAAHLEPDILIVDEVLAVGDVNFQRKCLGRMAEVAGEGRTVLFVSHNMAAIKQLCSRAILLEQGRLVIDGEPNAVIAEYSKTSTPEVVGKRERPTTHRGPGIAWVSGATLLDVTGQPAQQLFFAEPFRLKAVIEAVAAMDDAILEIGISTGDGIRVATLANTDAGGQHLSLQPGVQEVEIAIELGLLPRHDYVVDMAIHRSASGSLVDSVDRLLSFSVINVARESGDHYPWDQVRGYVRPSSRWSVAVRPNGSRRA